MSARITWIHLALVLLILVLPAAAAAQLVLYDNFNSTRIDPVKWIGVPASVPGDGDVDRREVSVGLAGKNDSRGLHISQTMYSSTANNTGAGGSGFGLGFANARKLTAVSFALAVNEAQSLGCGANAAFVVAGFSGDFFNPNPSPDGATGDITVSIAASRFSTDTGTTIEVGGGIAQCDDRKCNSQTTLSFADLGPVALGSANTLAVTWDQPNHQFIFQLNGNAPVASAYTVSDAYPPGLDLKSLFVFGSVPHCTGTPRPYATMDTLFDNVFVGRTSTWRTR
jgi:hypothetical protein